jgi:bifunctional UDP-N-acetylglucosamine pyrophosphorylase/glucosamine-1-phosphate N-acetyltransferase
VTCNYDGKHKHPTIIEDNVRIGSEHYVDRPREVGKGSVTAAGSVVTRRAAEHAVAGVPAKVKKTLTEEQS